MASFKQKISEQDEFLKTLTVSMKHQKKKLSSLENKKFLLERTNAELLRMYGEQNTAVGRSLGEVVKRAASRFVGIVMFISRTLTK